MFAKFDCWKIFLEELVFFFFFFSILGKSCPGKSLYPKTVYRRWIAEELILEKVPVWSSWQNPTVTSLWTVKQNYFYQIQQIQEQDEKWPCILFRIWQSKGIGVSSAAVGKLVPEIIAGIAHEIRNPLASISDPLSFRLQVQSRGTIRLWWKLFLKKLIDWTC